MITKPQIVASGYLYPYMNVQVTSSAILLVCDQIPLNDHKYTYYYIAWAYPTHYVHHYIV